jgi:hypothetical protein
MTKETASLLQSVLEERGFVDEQPENTWNMVQMKKEFLRVPSLAVWGRENWSGVVIQFHGEGYEDVVSIVETDDPVVLASIIDKATEFLEYCSALAPQRVPS